MIYTSYYAYIRSLPQDIMPVSIAGRAPDWYCGVEYKKVAPKIGFFNEWKQNNDTAFYIEHFNDEVLSHLSQKEVLDDLQDIMNRNGVKNIALCCYEKPSDFCHRHLVAKWLNSYIIGTHGMWNIINEFSLPTLDMIEKDVMAGLI